MNCKTIKAKFYSQGEAEGQAITTEKSLCFWGGLDPKSGKVIETNHPLLGEDITGKILVFPRGHGSSSSSGVLLEAIRCKHAPAAIINISCEPIIAIGSIVSRVLYGKSIPIAMVSEKDFYKIYSGAFLKVDGKNQRITILDKDKIPVN